MKRTMVFLLSLLACACECPITQGAVIGKNFRPSSRYSTVTVVGKVPVTTWHTRPACWEVSIRDGSSFATGCVPQKYYDNLNLGDTAWIAWN